MKNKILFMLFFITSLPILAQDQAFDRWTMLNDGSIQWQTTKNLPHSDHLEMSGQMISVVLHYGVNSQQEFSLQRTLIFPMLRHKPNKTHNHLVHDIYTDIASMVTIGEQNIILHSGSTKSINFNGIMRVESDYSYTLRRKKYNDAIHLTSTFYPSTTGTYYIEEYKFKNNSPNTITLRIPDWHLNYTSPEEIGIYGAYRMEASLSKNGSFELKPGDTLDFYALFSAEKMSDIKDNGALTATDIDVVAEHNKRQSLIDEWWGNLIIDTPDKVLNRMFAFAKLRGAESIYRTKGGLMHGPGGATYYAAVWANDQAEYINPFFPFLGYEVGNESALNCYRHFARFMNSEYKAIPSSIISEGAGIWHGAKDRGDAAMIGYGAARYALALGNKEVARELWPLIEWCLEYCKRQLTSDGVVASDSDELENRFPAGEANLNTSSLYYDALRSAVYLGHELDIPQKQIADYTIRAEKMEKAIEAYFGYEMHGFHTYRYYKGNTVLRSWICTPLSMGIYTRAKGTVDALFSRLWTKDGLLTQEGEKTFWDRSTLYALRGTLAAGELEKGMLFLKEYSHRRLLGEHVPYPIEAWPEGDQRHLSAEGGMYCRIYSEGLLGIRPTGFSNFEMTPRLPKDWSYMNLNKIRAFQADFDILISRIDENHLNVKVINGKKKVIDKNIKEGQKIKVKL